MELFWRVDFGGFQARSDTPFFNSKDRFFASTNFESFWSLELLFPASRSGFLCGKSCGFFDRQEYLSKKSTQKYKKSNERGKKLFLE